MPAIFKIPIANGSKIHFAKDFTINLRTQRKDFSVLPCNNSRRINQPKSIK